jgi:hypothetical protein
MENTIGQPRLDRLTAAKVEQGLYIQRSQGTVAAAAYFKENNVPMHVAIRVLTSANKRDVKDVLASPPSWRDVIMSAGPTYGVPVQVRRDD